jgi:hypothetical protein
LSRPYASLLADLTKAITGANAELEARAKRGTDGNNELKG